MPESDFIQQQRQLLRSFRQAADQRTRAEAAAHADAEGARSAAARTLQQTRQQAESAHKTAVSAAETRQGMARKSADNDLTQARRAADASLSDIEGAWDAVQKDLTRPGVDLGGVNVEPQVASDALGAGRQPLATLAQNAAAARKELAGLLDQLQTIQAADRRRRKVLGLAAGVIFLVALIGAGLALNARQQTLAEQRYQATATAQVATTLAEAPAALRQHWQELGIALPMVSVPAGEFQMGSPQGAGESDERPQRTVYLDAFWIGQTEVTNAQYQRCVAAGICRQSGYAGDGRFKGANQPVVGVSWDDATAYCAWAGLRLPTEAEWEKAARGTDGRIYPWGNQAPACDLANYFDCVGGLASAGSYPAGASPYGVLDMAGNVWEWVADWYDGNYYASAPAANPTGPAAGEFRVLRGGSTYNNDNIVRSAYRDINTPDFRRYGVGFRCARS